MFLNTSSPFATKIVWCVLESLRLTSWIERLNGRGFFFFGTVESLCVVVVVYLPSRHSFAHCFFINNEMRQVTAFKIH